MYYPETPISQSGKDQIREFARRLKEKGIKFDSIETSPLTRAVESARILTDILEIPSLVKNSAFTDSHVPGWLGIPLSEQQKLMDQGEDIYMNPRSADQEPYEHIAQRMVEGFNDLVRRNDGKTVAIVSHGDPIRLLMYRLEHPEGEIPNMSILSKEGYLKRGEGYRVIVDQEGRVHETELISIREGIPGKRESYTDSPH